MQEDSSYEKYDVQKNYLAEAVSPDFLPCAGIADKYRHDAELLRDRGAERRSLRILNRYHQPCVRAGDSGSRHDACRIVLRWNGYFRRRDHGGQCGSLLQPLNRRRARSNCICQSADSRLHGSAHRRRGDWLLQRFSGCKVKHPADGSDSYHVYRRARYRPADHGWTDHIRARGQLPYPGRFPSGIPGSYPVYRGGRRCGADFITLEENGTGYVHPVGRYQ